MNDSAYAIEEKAPFSAPEAVFADFDAGVGMRLAMAAGDIALVLDGTGRIVDISANPVEFPEMGTWTGALWSETVTIESRTKVAEMLERARKGENQRWRQVNHISRGGDVAVRYTVVAMAGGRRMIALGRDMRDSAAIQQRLLQAQQSLERDYMRLRQVETRYRLLFDMSAEPVLIVDADSQRIREANPAAHTLLDARSGTLVGARLTALFAHTARDPLLAFLGSVMTSTTVSPIQVEYGEGHRTLTLSATGFRQHGGRFLLVRLGQTTSEAREATPLLEVIERMPDAFVVADAGMRIVAANAAFVELAEAATFDQLRGRAVSEFVGRPGIDIELIENQLIKHGFARNVGTVVRGRDGRNEEPVELSAVRTGGDAPHFGFAIRQIGRRLRDLPPASQELPRSVEQLTELVGRVALKDIVRESTDLIERLCIEAALSSTSDTRASAAEVLGLSRQSLYSKLHRYGLGNLIDESD